MIYDAIVVGTGPAGSSAAFELARRGHRVLVLEAKRHPRYKVCGGGLSARLDGLIGREYHAVVERSVTRLTMAHNGAPAFELSFDAPLAYMTMRDRFDAHLIEQARRAGSEIREEEPAIGLKSWDGAIEVKTPQREYQARAIIGADGIPSIVAKTLLPKSAHPHGVALESETPAAKGRTWADDGVLIDIGAVRRGYAWIFPKGDHLSCGLATFQRGRQNVREAYRKFTEGRMELPPMGDQSLKGHLLPYFSPKTGPLSGNRVVLAGDAAGLVDPFLGEGIYYAIWSGRLAAEAVSGFLHHGISLASYEAAVRKEIHPELRVARRVAWIAYHFPRLLFGLTARHTGWLVGYGKVLQGRMSYQEFWKRCSDFRSWLRLPR